MRFLFCCISALVCCFAFSPVPAVAQYIGVKTVPVATDDQFMLFPSQNLGMAGVSIALDDPLLDPFVNPAKGIRTETYRFSASPALYASENSGQGAAFPVSTVLSSGRWFGGGAWAVQTVNTRDTPADGNTYVHGMIGSRLGDSDFSIGASVFRAGLEALQGINMLYEGSRSIEEQGDMLDLRFGLLGDFAEGRSLEALVLHSRYNMTHDVASVVLQYDPEFDRFTTATRQETNLDRTRTWGLHLGYVAPLAGTDWRIGGIVTANWKSHPKIPNYEVMNIPRDPGTSSAYNFGLGVSRSNDSTRLGVDLIYEPIWSNTWAVAEEPTILAAGWEAPPGWKTLENDFWFTNFALRIGFSDDRRIVNYQLGLALKTTYYQLKQWDWVSGMLSKHGQHWYEWSPTFGLSGTVAGAQLRYSGILTARTEDLFPWPRSELLDVSNPNSYDIVAAPGRPVRILDSYGFTQQICLSFPIKH